MQISQATLQAIISHAIESKASYLIKNIAEDTMSLEKFSYVYDVLFDRQFVSLAVEYCSDEILKTNYFYSLLGSDDGAIKFSLSDSSDEEVLSIEFEPGYDFDSLVENHK
ncbi:hypothetical protein [Paraferrimonas sp. SM1919]|uniref:hypothetical protein n=1 Tax=Paraferrimonas sp. SM1919 TaxID=2662263 RepID=UPI0013D22EC9|nr:hypothetical protein [Paraferrimonas sp. SM1919]